MVTLKHIAITGLVSIIYLTVACSSDLSEEETKQVKKALHDTLVSTTESWDMKLNIMENGQKMLQLEGQHATTISRSDTQMTRIQGPVHITIYDSTGKITTRAHSDRAIYYSRKASFRLYGDVVVKSQENRVLKSEYLHWNQKQNNVTTPRFVTIITATDSITGHGFTGTVDLSDYSIREVSGHVTINQEPDTTQ